MTFRIEEPLGSQPIQSVADAMEVLDGFEWGLSMEERAPDRWMLWAGEGLVAELSTREEADSFVAGMALSLAVLPPEVKDEVLRLTSD